MRNKLKQNYLLIILIIVQTIIYIIAGSYKQYLHIDEAYSYGLTNYERIEIQDNEDFYNNWHKKEYYNDYLTIQEDERGKYKPIYENQKNDVHPPLYYYICIYNYIYVFNIKKIIKGRRKVKRKSSNISIYVISNISFNK